MRPCDRATGPVSRPRARAASWRAFSRIFSKDPSRCAPQNRRHAWVYNATDSDDTVNRVYWLYIAGLGSVSIAYNLYYLITK